MREVLAGSSATFKLAPTQREIKPLGVKLDPRLAGLFRPGKKKGETVQLKKLRILSKGEKSEISYAGIAARAGKSKVKVGRKIKFI